MANVVVEQVYNKLFDMGLSFSRYDKAIRVKNIVTLEVVDKEESTIRFAAVHLDTKTVNIADLAIAGKTGAQYKIADAFEIFKGSWHDFLEWE